MNYEILYTNLFSNKVDNTEKYVSVLVRDDENFYIVGVVITTKNGKTIWHFNSYADKVKLGILDEKELELFLDKLKNNSKPFIHSHDNYEYEICDLIMNGTEEMKVAICDKNMSFHIADVKLSNGNLHVNSSYNFKTKDDILILSSRIKEFIRN